MIELNNLKITTGDILILIALMFLLGGVICLALSLGALFTNL